MMRKVNEAMIACTSFELQSREHQVHVHHQACKVACPLRTTAMVDPPLMHVALATVSSDLHLHLHPHQNVNLGLESELESI
jgi:hypothetical protein